MRGSDPTVPTRNLGLRSGRRTCWSTCRSRTTRYIEQHGPLLLIDHDPESEVATERCKFPQLTCGSCGRRSWMLYLTQAITALKTCSSLRTLSSSLEIISINWLAGSSMNSSLSMTCDIRAVRQQRYTFAAGIKDVTLQSHFLRQ